MKRNLHQMMLNISIDCFFCAAPSRTKKDAVFVSNEQPAEPAQPGCNFVVSSHVFHILGEASCFIYRYASYRGNVVNRDRATLGVMPGIRITALPHSSTGLKTKQHKEFKETCGGF